MYMHPCTSSSYVLWLRIKVAWMVTNRQVRAQEINMYSVCEIIKRVGYRLFCYHACPQQSTTLQKRWSGNAGTQGLEGPRLTAASVTPAGEWTTVIVDVACVDDRCTWHVVWPYTRCGNYATATGTPAYRSWRLVRSNREKRSYSITRSAVQISRHETCKNPCA
jgi:hypothetical protein